jgi:hypothetical protein
MPVKQPSRTIEEFSFMKDPVREFDDETVKEHCKRKKIVADLKNELSACTNLEEKETIQSKLSSAQKDLAICLPKRKVIKALRFHKNPLVSSHVSLTFMKFSIKSAGNALACTRTTICYGFVFSLEGGLKHFPVTCPFACDLDQLEDALLVATSPAFEDTCDEIFCSLINRALTVSRNSYILHRFCALGF